MKHEQQEKNNEPTKNHHITKAIETLLNALLINTIYPHREL